MARSRTFALALILAAATPALADVTLQVDSPTRAPHLTWTDSSPSGLGYVVLRSRDTCRLGGATVVGTGSVSFFDDLTAIDGMWCYAVAPTGGTASAEALVRVDTTPPTVAISMPLAGGFVAGDVTLQATAVDPGGSGIVSVEFLAGATSVPAVATNGLYTAVWSSRSVSDGPITIAARALDAVGNEATSPVAVTVDNAPPTGTFTAPVPDSVNAGDVTIAAALDDAGSGVATATFEASTDGFVSVRTLASIADPATRDVAYLWHTTAADDAAGYAFRVHVVDRAGNDAMIVGPTGVRIDNTAPVAPHVAVGAPTFLHAAPAIGWSASESGDVVSYRVLRDGVVLANTVVGTSFTDPTVPDDGSHDYTIEAFDGLHLSAPSAAIPVFVDTAAPASPASVSDLIAPHTRNVALTWAPAVDAPRTPGGPFSGVGSYAVVRDGQPVAALAATETTWTDLQTADATSYVYEVAAVDLAGNRSVAASITVVTPDITPPHAAAGLSSRVRGASIKLSWRTPADADLARVVVVRNAGHAPATPTDGEVLYSGLGASLATRQAAGSRFAYVVFAVDRAANATPTAALRILVPASRLAPLAGSELNGRVVLSWAASKGATYYNVQLFANGKKVLDRWPTRRAIAVPRKLLHKGVRYTWFVWPGLGPISARRYGAIVGQSAFTFLG